MIVSCAALAIALANPVGGQSYTLAEDCRGRAGKPALVIRNVFRRPVSITAHGRTVYGIVFDGGGNLRWTGGRIEAPGGSGSQQTGTGPAHYGILLRRAQDVVFDAVSLSNARKAIVFSDESRGLTVVNSRCFGEVEDCLIASGGQGLVFSRNHAGPFTTHHGRCLAGARPAPALSRRTCLGRGARWQGGWHSDVVQLRNGIRDVVIEGNVIETTGQGLTQMDKPTDAPIGNVRIAGNQILAGRHGITLGRCNGCAITGNVLRTAMGHLGWKAVILPGDAKACGNTVPSGGSGRQPC